ncbi:UNVERIFIED_ORG: hypothetical protein OKW16_001930 [Pseudomonas reinekei]|nr:hypothetical protein [Pseudomonas reinekei]
MPDTASVNATRWVKWVWSTPRLCTAVGFDEFAGNGGVRERRHHA